MLSKRSIGAPWVKKELDVVMNREIASGEVVTGYDGSCRRGGGGNCTDYILSIAEKLASLKIADKTVEDFANSLKVQYFVYCSSSGRL